MEGRSYLLKRSMEFASSALARISASYTFHTLEHTKQVVRAAEIIGRASKFSPQQLDTTLIAAWFHDVGYVDGAERHEERSSSIAVKMLTTWGANTKMIADVSRSILATRASAKSEGRAWQGFVRCQPFVPGVSAIRTSCLQARQRARGYARY